MLIFHFFWETILLKKHFLSVLLSETIVTPLIDEYVNSKPALPISDDWLGYMIGKHMLYSFTHFWNRIGDTINRRRSFSWYLVDTSLELQKYSLWWSVEYNEQLHFKLPALNNPVNKCGYCGCKLWYNEHLFCILCFCFTEIF